MSTQCLHSVCTVSASVYQCLSVSVSVYQCLSVSASVCRDTDHACTNDTLRLMLVFDGMNRDVKSKKYLFYSVISGFGKYQSRNMKMIKRKNEWLVCSQNRPKYLHALPPLAHSAPLPPPEPDVAVALGSNRLSDRPTAQQTNQPTNRTTDQPTNRPTIQPTKQLTDRPTNQPTNY